MPKCSTIEEVENESRLLVTSRSRQPSFLVIYYCTMGYLQTPTPSPGIKKMPTCLPQHAHLLFSLRETDRHCLITVIQWESREPEKSCVGASYKRWQGLPLSLAPRSLLLPISPHVISLLPVLLPPQALSRAEQMLAPGSGSPDQPPYFIKYPVLGSLS